MFLSGPGLVFHILYLIAQTWRGSIWRETAGSRELMRESVSMSCWKRSQQETRNPCQTRVRV